MKHLDHLGQLRDQLTELLTLLEDEHADPAALEHAMQSCAVVFEALRAGFPAHDQIEADDRERLTDALESTLRLNAVALNRASRAGEELVRGIAQTKRARQHASALATEPSSGTSYDLSA